MSMFEQNYVIIFLGCEILINMHTAHSTEFLENKLSESARIVYRICK